MMLSVSTPDANPENEIPEPLKLMLSPHGIIGCNSRSSQLCLSIKAVKYARNIKPKPNTFLKDQVKFVHSKYQRTKA